MANDFDIIVIGSGPAGQKAAVQGAKAGKRVALIESDRYVGGHCVHKGTIPSKTLRENALRVSNLRHFSDLYSFNLREEIPMGSLISNLDKVIKSHDQYIQKQIARNSIEFIHGRANFVDPHTVEIRSPGGERSRISGDYFILATGSYPRKADGIPVDHEHVYDSDSILSIIYLPESLTVLGGGVIASEYASIFQTLGTKVTMIDRYPTPLGFLDSDLTDRFVKDFEERGGRWIGNATVQNVAWDGVSHVVTELDNGEVVRSEKLLSAAGRIANVKGLDIDKAGLAVNDAGVIPVDSHCKTQVDHIYAAGDVIGPPSLASASMEQGRRASCSALGIDLEVMTDTLPMGIYGIPEMSAVGLSEKAAVEKHGSAVVGYASFEEIARGEISAIQNGLLKLVADPQGETLVGAHIVGEGATELIHIAQMGLIYGATIDSFVENIFNFPTLAEAYRVAALQIVGKRPA